MTIATSSKWLLIPAAVLSVAAVSASTSLRQEPPPQEQQQQQEQQQENEKITSPLIRLLNSEEKPKLQVFVCQKEATTTTTTTTKKEDKRDRHCPDHHPICVNSQQQILSSPGMKGVQCVVCVAYFDTPMDPDYGCTVNQPICVNHKHERPKNDTAGIRCMDYPCRRRRTMTNHNRQHNHHHHHNNNNPLLSSNALVEIDTGCTESNPYCVDALGNIPSEGNPGVKCISTTNKQNKRNNKKKKTIAIQTEDWKNEKNQDSSNSSPKNSCLILNGQVDPLPWTSNMPLCHGCPFGISKQCAIGAKLNPTNTHHHHQQQLASW